jgi:AraC-like DNA-binding protein
MVGAYFHPGGLPAFTNLPVHELTNGTATVEDIWGPAAAEIAGRLAEVNEVARVDALESMLIERLGEKRQPHTTVDVPGLAASIHQSGGQVIVEQLAFGAGISRQQLTRLFRQRVGVTPKLYARLARFHSGLACAGSRTAANWAQMALELGYADQSHWIAEFKEFSGLTPQQFAARRWLHPFVEHRSPRSGAHEDRRVGAS